jgi:hypothetical protein
MATYTGKYKEPNMAQSAPYYAVFFFAPGLEALGQAIQPYLSEGPAGPFVLCHEIDTGGQFVELSIRAQDKQGKHAEVKLLIPSPMIRLIASVESEGNRPGFA